MRVLIFTSLFLVHLGLLVRCAMEADPANKATVATLGNDMGILITTSAKLVPTANGGYGVFYYNHGTKLLASTLGFSLNGFENSTRFNAIASPARDSFIVAAIASNGVYKSINVVVMNATTAARRQGYTESMIPVSKEPGLAFINSTALVVTYDKDAVPGSFGSNPVAYKALLWMSLTDLVIRPLDLYFGEGSQAGGSVSAVGGGDWLAAWDDEGLKRVFAYSGSGLPPSNPITFQVSSADETQLHTPSVSYPFIAYVGNGGTLYVAKVSQTQVLGTYDLGAGSEPHLFSVTGATTNVTVLSYVRATNEICMRVQSVQYPSFSEPICWSEGTPSTVSGPSSLVLSNGTIVVVYSLDRVPTRRYLTQTFPPRCGDSVISPSEECDGEVNCVSCVCKPLSERVPGGIACPLVPPMSAPVVTPIASPVTSPIATPVNTPTSTPIASPLATPVESDPTPAVIPLLDCYTLLNTTHVRGYFSYENLVQGIVRVPVGPTNRFVFPLSTSSHQDVGQTTEFTPGRTSYFPASSFAVTWDKQSISWFLTKYQLEVDPTRTLYICPQNVSVDVDIRVSKLPNATELEKIAAEIAKQLGVDPSRIIVTISEYEGGITITITIIGTSGADSIASVLIAEKLVEAIKNKPSDFEDSLKDVLPDVAINSGSVRGKPDAVTGQRGELVPMAPSALSNSAPTIFNIVSFAVEFVLVMLNKL